MKINLIHKKALVGGSSKGLGKSIALELAKNGASVTIMARNKEALQALVSKMDTSQGQVHQFLIVDFYNFNEYQNIISNYFKSNSVDILVNNTNGPEGGTVFDKTTKDYQTAFDLLFKTTQFTTMCAIKQMEKNGFGRIINATSISVVEPINHLILSNTIRAAVTTWAKTLATSIASKGITVNNILTGIFDTERIKELNKLQAKQLNISEDEVLLNLKNSIPMKRIGNPKEFGYLVNFLASEYASYITGTNIVIDGGLVKSL
ncbi:SDR family oxidoreductase [Lutibacter sp. TH_r2]|uniref:SDR family oxidoreductase n=1 Tax=Lutibacter sp. TH_r2 TaxID=3082083 RepID=UPI002952A21E|nr:SDR family oxidoreductase [Lutibacter sp. TH_r2]MDV7188331.1 SDR family oxidoreductase [Lutibacter sp. TH_r2]